MVAGSRGRRWGSLSVLVALALVASAVGLLAPGASARQATPEASPVASPAAAAEPVFAPACEVPTDQTYTVAMVIAQGGLGDQSYNDLADAGL